MRVLKHAAHSAPAAILRDAVLWTAPQDEVGVKPPTASDQNNDDCRSSVFGLRARLGGAFFSESIGAAAAAAIWSALSGSSKSGASFATRLTAVEIS